MPHTNENPSQQNKEILESFAKEFGHNLFCKDFPENEPKTCRCDYTEFKDFLLSSLQEQAQAIINELESNPNEDGSISPNIQHWIEQKQIQLRNKFIK